MSARPQTYEAAPPVLRLVPDPDDCCAICFKELTPSQRKAGRSTCGAKECVAQARLFGLRRAAAIRRRRAREAQAKTERECTWCHTVKPLTDEYWYARLRDPVTGAVRYWANPCRTCDSARPSKYGDSSPEARERRLKRQAERRRTLRQDPAYVEKQRRFQRESKRRQRQRNPEVPRETQRRYRERVRQDPERYAAFLEARRIEYTLREERRRGRTPKRRAYQQRHDDGFQVLLSVGPLVRVIEEITRREEADLSRGLVLATESRRHGRLEYVCKRAGVDSRRLREWRKGGTVEGPVADRALQLLRLNWWEVWPEDDLDAYRYFVTEKV